jgi:predicted nuclease of predicted toxin-antitoxin system
MKLLFDENLSAALCARLADLFPDSSQVRLLGLTQANHGAIWERAKAGGFAIVSLDACTCGHHPASGSHCYRC